MEQVGDRIHFLRKNLNLSQESFGDKIGIKKASMSAIENNRSNPSNQTVKLICNEFNVSYNWLVDGIGDVFIEDDESTIEMLKRDYNLRDVEVRLIEEFLKLDENERDVLINYLERAVGRNEQ